MEEEFLLRFQRKILRIIFGPTQHGDKRVQNVVSTILQILSNTSKVADCDGLGMIYEVTTLES